MERYESYKDSGVEWIGEIPSGWETYPFLRFFSLGKGLSITKANLTDEGIPVISYGQIHAKRNTGTRTHRDLLRFVSPDDGALLNPCRTKVGDIVLADTSEDIEGCGASFFIDVEGVYAGYHTLIARPRNVEHSHYLSYLFQSDEWRSQIRKKVSGVKLFSVTKRILGGNSILLPPISEAKAIADFLDVKTAEIDALIADCEREVELLQEYRKAVISEAVTKGLDPDAPMKDSGIEWIGEMPENWDVIPLRRCIVRTGNGITRRGDYDKDGTLVLKLRNIN